MSNNNKPADIINYQSSKTYALILANKLHLQSIFENEQKKCTVVLHNGEESFLNSYIARGTRRLAFNKKVTFFLCQNVLNWSS